MKRTQKEHKTWQIMQLFKKSWYVLISVDKKLCSTVIALNVSRIYVFSIYFVCLEASLLFVKCRVILSLILVFVTFHIGTFIPIFWPIYTTCAFMLQLSENLLTVTNSVKMKLSIVFGVIHMLFGIFLSLWNFMWVNSMILL